MPFAAHGARADRSARTRLWPASLLTLIAAAVALGAPPRASAATPNTTITAHPPAATKSRTAAFHFSSTPSPAYFQCSLNGSTWAYCASGKTYSSLSDGSYTFRVRAQTADGFDPTPASWAWKVDNVAPVIATLHTNLGRAIGTGASVEVNATWSASDASSGLNHYQLYRRTGTTWSAVPVAAPPGHSVFQFAPTAVSMLYALRAFDNAGNVSAFKVSSPFSVGIIDDSSSSIAWTGSWQTLSNPAFHGGATKTSTTTNSTATFTPGPVRQFGFVTDTAPERGIFAWTYGTSSGTYSLTSDTFEPRLILFSFWTSAGGMTVRVTGTSKAPSTSVAVDVDAFVVMS